MESVILETPLLLCGFSAEFGLVVFSLIKKLGFIATVISSLIFSATLTYSLLLGAGLYEVAICSVAFFVVSMIPLCRRGGK